MSKVAVKKVDAETKEGVEKAVSQAMRLAQWKKRVAGKEVFLKINAMCDQLIPSQNTSPWFLEAVIKELKNRKGIEIIMGDADVATTKQFLRAVRVWGYDRIAEKHGVRVVNLSEDEEVEQDINGKVFKRLSMPKVLNEVDSIITLPVMKTHGITRITCSLKNQWGCVPRVRQQYHLVVNQAIAEINKHLGVKFGVVDGTICMEGVGPRNGKPKICNVILASHDLVSLDSACAEYMGLKPEEVPKLKLAEKMMAGSTGFSLIGDSVKPNRFEPAKQHIVFKTEMKLRRTPILNKLIFKTPLFRFFGWGTTRYNKLFWYYKEGKKHVREVMRSNYGKEFS